MDWSLALRGRLDLIVAFVGGTVVPVLVAILAHLLQRRHERQRTLAERRFDVYMRLMDLHAQFFWYASHATSGQPVPQEVRERCQTLAWQLADKLRAIDDDAQVDVALDVLFRIDYSASAGERERALTALIDRMGKTVNPRYAKRMADISTANTKAMAAGKRSNAPGALWPLI